MLKGIVLAISLMLTSASVEAATTPCTPGCDLQQAINNAQAGDTIVLTAGGVYKGNFILPSKSGVTITSSAALPERRMGPADAPMMPLIGSVTGEAALKVGSGWTLDGLAFERNPGGFGNIIEIEGADSVVLKRLYVNIPDPLEQKRFILGNGTNITLTQSYCSGIMAQYQDAQCFVAYDGAGPYTITDNFLEAGGENIMFGGADPSSALKVPSNILVENNFFTKREIWRGQPRGVKNIFELKAAKGVIVRNNIFEKNWYDAQQGRAIVITPRNQNCTASYVVVQDVLFEDNIIRDTPVGVSVLGYDDNCPSMQTTNIIFRRNTVQTTGGQCFLLMNEVGSMEITANICESPYFMTLSAEGDIATSSGLRAPLFAVDRLTLYDNQYSGLIHSATALGQAALDAYVENLTTSPGGTPPPPPPPPPAPTTDPRLIALEARVDALVKYLQATPSNLSKIQQLISYIRGVK